MLKKNLIFLIIIILVIIIAIAGGIYYIVFVLNGVKAPSGDARLQARLQARMQQIAQAPPPPDPAKQLETIQKNYPEIITGTIRFFDTKNSFKATLTTDAGIEYLLWQAQPKAIYESFGAKNGGKVQVNGKPLDGGKLSWALMKPI